MLFLFFCPSFLSYYQIWYIKILKGIRNCGQIGLDKKFSKKFRYINKY